MKIVWFLSLILFGICFLKPQITEAGVIRLGFYYAPTKAARQPDFSKISKAIDTVLIDLNQHMGIPTKNVFIKKLPFSPATTQRGPNWGVDGEAFLDNIEKHGLGYKNADFVFFIITTPIVLLLTSCDDGFAEGIPGKLAIVRYRDQPSQDYFAIVIAHELGHLIGLEHLPNDSCGSNNPLIMCPSPMKSVKKIILGKSFRDAIRNASH